MAGALRAPVGAVTIRALRALMAGALRAPEDAVRTNILLLIIYNMINLLKRFTYGQ